MSKPARPPRTATQDPGGRWGLHPAAIGAIAAAVAVLVTLLAWLFPHSSTPTPRPTTTTSVPCGRPVAADGFSAEFVDPCDEAVVDNQYPVVKVRVPRYPVPGRLVLVTRVLTDPSGTPLNPTLIYGQYPVDTSTARAEFSGHGVWGKDITIGTKDCTKGGRVELIVLLLTPDGAAEAATWQPGVPLTIPAGSQQLDSIFVTRTDRTC